MALAIVCLPTFGAPFFKNIGTRCHSSLVSPIKTLVQAFNVEKHGPAAQKIMVDNFGTRSVPRMLYRKSASSIQKALTILADDSVAGIMIYEDEPAVLKRYFAWYAIDAQYRKQGIGSDVLRQFHTKTFDAGMKQIYLIPENEHALRFFEKHGYLLIDGYMVKDLSDNQIQRPTH